MTRATRVMIDGFFYDRSYGFGRYVRELVSALDASEHNLEPILLVPTPARSWAETSLQHVQIVAREPCLFPLWEQVRVPTEARRFECDIVHFPYQSVALAWPRRAAVVTVHDLMFLRPSGTSGDARDWIAHMYRRGAFTHAVGANQLVAVSASTRDELRRRTGREATVITNTCEAFVRTNAGARPAHEEGRFFMHRGDRGPHKNTQRVIAAFAQVRAARPEVRLLIYGAAAGEELLDGMAGRGVTFLGKISDARLSALYRAAVAVVVPSLEEGFGLSIVEAFGFGAPVITSERAPMSDVAGGAALLVDPTRTDAIASAMRNLLEEPALGRRLRDLSQARYTDFSSARIATELAAVYQRAAQERRHAAHVYAGRDSDT